MLNPNLPTQPYRRPLRLLSLLAMVALLLLAAGCSDEDKSPLEADLTGADDYQNLDLSQEFGGLTVSDEDEAFADEGLKAMMYAEEDGDSDDPLLDDPEVLAWEAVGEDPSDPDDPDRPRFTFLRLRWGMIRGPEDTLDLDAGELDPENYPTLDWTGEIHTDRGLVVVRRLLRFERFHGDHLVRPRLNPQTVAFVSHTAGHYDGLVLEIIERPQDENAEGVTPNVLHINTGPFQGEYPVAELAELDELISVDAAGNSMQLTGFTLSDIAYCPKGFLSGRYLPLPEDAGDPELGEGEEDPCPDCEQIGTFAGAYVDLSGRIHGFLRGGYGLDENGERIFVGKYIGRRGGFRGLVRGSWEPGDTETALGSFQGQWFGAGGNLEGYLEGRCHPVEGSAGGFYEGRWTAACDQQAEDQTR